MKMGLLVRLPTGCKILWRGEVLRMAVPPRRLKSWFQRLGIFVASLAVFSSGVYPQVSTQVALLLPRTGKFKDIGQEFLNGLQLALTVPITVRVWDTKGRMETTRKLIRHLRRESVVLTVGPLASSTVYAALQVLGPDMPPLYSPTSLLPDQCAKSDRVFGRFAVLCAEADRLISWMASQKPQGVVVLYPDTPEGIARARALRLRLEPFSFRQKQFVSYSESNYDYRFLDTVIDTLVTDWVILCGAGPTALGLFHRLRYLRYFGPVISFSDWLYDLETRFSPAIDSLYLVAFAPVSVDTPFPWMDRREDAVDAYRRKYKHLPSEAALRGYVTGEFLNRLFAHPLNSRDTVREALAQVSYFVGIEGPELLSPRPDFIKLFLLSHGTLKEVPWHAVIRKRQSASEAE